MTNRTGLLLLLVVFIGGSAARLNPFCLLEPDTPDYLFTSRALATLEGYSEIDHPDRPRHTFRPPGLPLMLTPIARLRPYDVVAAKLLIMALSAAMLVLVYRFGRRVTDAKAALAVTAVVATSPYTVLHATEVVTEVPYLVGVLWIVGLLADTDLAPSRRQLAVATAVLASLPFVRTIGLALVAAVGLWAVSRRVRWSWLPPAGFALLAALGWAMRNRLAAGRTYGRSIGDALDAGGVVGVADRAASHLGFYAGRFADMLLPGLGPGRPLYERFMLDAPPDAGRIAGLAIFIAIAIAVLAVIGVHARRRREGLAVGLYVVFYVVALVVYPPRHERLMWPLIPLIWLFAAVGARAVGGRLVAKVAVAAVLAGLVFGQVLGTVAVISSNLSWLRGGEDFHDREVPPIYYSEWQAAGEWLELHAPPHARVLTRHSDLGFTSRRWQDSLRFEELSPLDVRRRVASFRARYVVVPTTLFDRLIENQALNGDPVYRFVTVFEAGGVRVLEIRPNREGTVDLDRGGLVRRIEACRFAIERHPKRIELRRRLAELLHSVGRSEEAIAELHRALEIHGEDVRVHKSLGSILLELERFGAAREAFHKAAGLPGAALLSDSIDRGAQRAEAGLQRPPASRADQVRRLVATGRKRIDALLFRRAEDAAREALRLAPHDPEVLVLQARFVELTAGPGAAETHYRQAASRGIDEAAASLARLGRERALRDAPAASSAAYLQVAAELTRAGVPGRALDLLEQASGHLPGSVEIKRRLADLYLFYGLAEDSEPLYRSVLRERIDDAEARRGLELSLELQRPADY